MNIIIIEADPIFIEFEIVAFERNIVITCVGLLEIDFHEVAFEIIVDGILGVVRVEIGVSVNVFDVLGFSECGLEF
jgi:hypothetical protein